MMRTVGRFLFALFLITNGFGAHSRLSAQNTASRTAPSYGLSAEASRSFHALRFILYSMNLEPLGFPAELNKNPENTVLIVLGNTRALDGLSATRMRDWLDAGIAILIATDAESATSLHEAFGVRVVGDTVGSTDPRSQYRRLPDCPIITDFDANCPLVRGAARFRVATNIPGYLERDDAAQGLPRFRSVARFPPTSTVGGALHDRLPFAMLHDSGKGRALVLSDQSVFINSMMIQDDNDNFDFAVQTVRWLTDNGKRKRVYFLEDGEPVSNFNVSLKDGLSGSKRSIELPENPVAVVNHVLTNWEDDNIFNRLILERFGNIHRVVSGIAVLVTAALIAYGYFRLRRVRHVAEPDW